MGTINLGQRTAPPYFLLPTPYVEQARAQHELGRNGGNVQFGRQEPDVLIGAGGGRGHSNGHVRWNNRRRWHVSEGSLYVSDASLNGIARIVGFPRRR